MDPGLSNRGKVADRRQQQQLVDLMTRSLPGILRLDGENPQTDDVSASSSSSGFRPDHARTVRLERPATYDGNEDRPKVKKRVTFQPEEHLEIIMEISPRHDSPLFEELEPCDPEKLMLEDGGGRTQGDLYGAGSYPNNVNSVGSGNKNADVVTRISGLMGFGLPIPVAPALITTRKGRPRLPERRSMTQERQEKSILMNHTHKRIRSAPPLKTSSSNKDDFSSYGSPMEQRFSRLGSVKSASLGSKSGSHRDKAATGHVFRGGHIRPKSPVTKRELLTPNLTLGRSRNIPPRTRNDSLYARSHQVHQSPYRQGASSAGSRRSVTRSDASSLSVTGSRMDAHNKAERRVMFAPSVSPRKIQAWQEANMALRTNGLLVSEPCIAQLWDHDPSYGPKCS
ncbi:hypothetical protein LSH36_211g03033 [Paralvinella palmiformis]|uniref:Uncharacterized protein n=1 Tax=Paralvinella palmiformis TaxID=53620 RepID=A0AAD9JNL8_9ANNE|nr:hypothetical protein LSH36_211g03033 [Paralvinella palmiformis]